jgi:hypothetical protein
MTTPYLLLEMQKYVFQLHCAEQISKEGYRNLVKKLTKEIEKSLLEEAIHRERERGVSRVSFTMGYEKARKDWPENRLNVPAEDFDEITEKLLLETFHDTI